MNSQTFFDRIQQLPLTELEQLQQIIADRLSSARYTERANAETELMEGADDETEIAIAGSDAGANPVWKYLAMDSLVEFALTHRYLSAFEITSEVVKLGVDTNSLTAMGSVMRKAAKNGLISHTHTFTNNLRGHKSPTPVWESLIYRGVSGGAL